MTLDDVIEMIRKNIILFDRFDKVYIFGSFLSNDTVHNDIDILLIYGEYSSCMRMELDKISNVLENDSGFPIDLTVLSQTEIEETKFLRKLNKRYIKIK